MSNEPPPTPPSSPPPPGPAATPPPVKPGLAAGVSVKPTLPSVGATAASGPGLSGAAPATFRPPASTGAPRPGVAFQKPKLRTPGAAGAPAADASAHKVAAPSAVANDGPSGALVGLSAVAAIVAVAGAILLYLKHTA